MLHSDSPETTVCATAAPAGEGMAAAAKATVSGAIMRRTRGTSCVFVCCSTPHVSGFLPAQVVMGGLTECCTRRCTAACEALRPMDAADLRLWAQKWRYYDRNALPWNRPRIPWGLAPRRAFARRPPPGGGPRLPPGGPLGLGGHGRFQPGGWGAGPAPA